MCCVHEMVSFFPSRAAPRHSQCREGSDRCGSGHVRVFRTDTRGSAPGVAGEHQAGSGSQQDRPTHHGVEDVAARGAFTPHADTRTGGTHQ